MNNRLSCFFPLLLLLCGCVVTRTPGFYTGYDRLTGKERESVVFTAPGKPVCDLEQDEKVYAVTGSQLRECLAQNDSSVVYFWEPNCSSSACILISSCQDYCRQHKYRLYVVAGYYDHEKMRIQNVADFPILIANERYYGKKYANALTKRFQTDLLNGHKIPKEKAYARFLFFAGDSLIAAKNDLFSTSER